LNRAAVMADDRYQGKDDGNGARIAWNLLGFVLPLAIAAAAVPQLLNLIGGERFGYLALAWGLIGYASVIDLGIGRAATQIVASLRGGPEQPRIPDVVASAARLTAATGAAGMLLIAALAWAGAYRLVPSSTVPAHELLLSMLLLALALPMQAISATWRGVNEAFLNFGPVSLLRILLGAANFGAPWIIAMLTHEMHWLVATLVLSRAAALVCYRYFALRCLRRAGLGRRGRYSPCDAQRLLRFGGWHSLSSLLSPLLVQADRFLIGALISAAAVTAYVIPYELTVQSLVLSGAVTTVAFPLISNRLTADRGAAHALFDRWLLRLTAVVALAMGLLAWLMPDLLRLWLDGKMSPESILAGRILCAGVLFNTIGAMYFSLLHAHGKTMHTALLHLIEVPPYLLLLYLLIASHGVAGAALAWSLRTGVDAAALALLARRTRRRATSSDTIVPALP
jgi:O-antigen/teichoic acid export membrane protein